MALAVTGRTAVIGVRAAMHGMPSPALTQRAVSGYRPRTDLAGAVAPALLTLLPIASAEPPGTTGAPDVSGFRGQEPLL